MSRDSERRNTTNELARERNLLAADRTLLAWLRTALSLIGFGFAIAQGYEYLESGYLDEASTVLDSNRTPFYFGLSFMALGLLGAGVGALQYWTILKQLRKPEFAYTEPWPFALVVAVLLLIVGLIGMAAVVS